MIPYGRQDITQEDIEAVVKILHSDFLTQGPAVPVFEKKLCNYTGAKHAIVVNSCTAALHIACLALGLGSGDILWTSAITFVASANCALYCGATVDFVDIDPDTALMSVEKLEEKLILAEKEGKLPKIVIPVHFSGQSCDMREIYNLSQLYGFKIVEDAAHAIGAKYQNTPVGRGKYSDITVFSFHPVKIITTGEGGAAITNNPLYAEKMELLRSHGVSRDTAKMQNNIGEPWYYEQIELGFNYRMTDIQAALGSSQLDRLDQYVSRRNEIAKWYNEHLNFEISNPLIQKTDRESACHLYVVRIMDSKHTRDEVFHSLRENDIGVNLHYIPVYRHPFFYTGNYLENAESYYKQAISLPIYPTINDKNLCRVVNCISSFQNNSLRV